MMVTVPRSLCVCGLVAPLPLARMPWAGFGALHRPTARDRSIPSCNSVVSALLKDSVRAGGTCVRVDPMSTTGDMSGRSS